MANMTSMPQVANVQMSMPDAGRHRDKQESAGENHAAEEDEG
jgi:hypothetical protein